MIEETERRIAEALRPWFEGRAREFAATVRSWTALSPGESAVYGVLSVNEAPAHFVVKPVGEEGGHTISWYCGGLRQETKHVREGEDWADLDLSKLLATFVEHGPREAARAAGTAVRGLMAAGVPPEALVDAVRETTVEDVLQR